MRGVGGAGEGLAAWVGALVQEQVAEVVGEGGAWVGVSVEAWVGVLAAALVVGCRGWEEGGGGRVVVRAQRGRGRGGVGGLQACPCWVAWVVGGPRWVQGAHWGRACCLLHAAAVVGREGAWHEVAAVGCEEGGQAFHWVRRVASHHNPSASASASLHASAGEGSSRAPPAAAALRPLLVFWWAWGACVGLHGVVCWRCRGEAASEDL